MLLWSHAVKLFLRASYLSATTGICIGALGNAASGQNAVSAIVTSPPKSDRSQACPSAALWQNLNGPQIWVPIGHRTLHLPASLPYFHADRAETRNSAWFDFHIDSKNHWSFGTDDPSRPFAWEYLIEIELTNAPGRVDNKSFLQILLNGEKKDGKLSDDNKSYDVYPGVLGETYVGKGQNSKLLLHCWDIDSSLKIKQVPYCRGYERPWSNAALTYTFGRDFLPIAPQILSCINVLIDDFSR